MVKAGGRKDLEEDRMILDRIASKLATLTPARLDAFRKQYPLTGIAAKILQEEPEILEELKRNPKLNLWGKDLVARLTPLLEEPES